MKIKQTNNGTILEYTYKLTELKHTYKTTELTRNYKHYHTSFPQSLKHYLAPTTDKLYFYCKGNDVYVTPVQPANYIEYEEVNVVSDNGSYAITLPSHLFNNIDECNAVRYIFDTSKTNFNNNFHVGVLTVKTIKV